MTNSAALWDELAATALVGTARAPLPSFAVEAPALAALLARLTEGTTERRLLAAAGTTALWQQAGTQPEAGAAVLPTPAPVETYTVCPALAESYLERLLDREYPELLPEWFALAAQHDVSLSPRLLPETLTLLAKQPELRDYIAPRLGARGRWLAAHNPDWRALLAAPSPEDWETGAQAVRVAYLRHLRAQDPDAARARLEAAWPQESAADRAAFVAVLREQLSPADEPFLEAALDDKSKQVRAAALAVLRGLPNADLLARHYRRASQLLRVERGRLKRAKLIVTLPETCDAALERDGVMPTPPQGVGPRAWWLRQILAAVPPGVWTRDWELTPAGIIRLAAGSDYSDALPSDALLAGWSEATARYPDAAWGMALLEQWIETPAWAWEDLTAFCKSIRPETLTPWLAQQVRGVQRSAHKTQILEALRAYPYPWDEALTRAFIAVMQKFVQQEGKNVSESGVWNAALPELARVAAPALVHEAEANWSHATGYWQRNIERFVATLHFRHEMRRAFTPPIHHSPIR